MAQHDPLLIRILASLGFNTTKLRWRLYQMEQRAQQARKGGVLPGALHWLRYEHKICRRCGAVNARETKQCHRCGRRIPGMIGYRMSRMLGLMMPDQAPVMCTLFLTAMVLVYGVGILLDGFGFRAIFGPSSDALRRLGAYSDQFQGGGAIWRMLSMGLVHGGLMHIGFNAFALTQIGPIVENALGRKRMLVLITACQICAAYASLVWYTQVSHRGFLTVGASGWVFGLIGFGAAYFHRTGAHMFRNVLIQWAIYSVLFGILLGANNAAHIGGMAAGALLSGFPSGRGFSKDERDPVWDLAFWICVGLWLITIGCMARSIIS